MTDPHDFAAQARARRQQLAADPQRPRYHFLPPSNWMNDPNGLIHWRGMYHLFYQHNPGGALWGDMHWGHAASPDLVHWQDYPIALAPSPGGPDRDGVFSGCAVVDGDVPTLLYTGVWPEAQCLATSADDDLRSWTKYAGNPVIAAPPSGLDVAGFRDPCVWREADGWYMVIGSGSKGGTAAVLLYTSPDLRAWRYLGPLLVGGPEAQDVVWECPSFFQLGEKHVLIVSWTPLAGVRYFVGHYENHRFTPESEHVLDAGSAFYAPQTFRDGQGRRLMFGWLIEGRVDAALEAAGWAGVQSAPRLLSLRPDGLLGIEPAPELSHLRGAHHHWEQVEVTAPLDLPAAGDCLEIAAKFMPGDAAALGLRLRCSPDGAEQTVIVYDAAAGTLTVDRSRASLGEGVQWTPEQVPLPLADGEPLGLRLFLDRSVLEIFANGHCCLTTRLYPTRPDSLGLQVFAQGGTARLLALDVWLLESIWS